MKPILINCLILALFFASCEKDSSPTSDNLKANAEIIAFNSEKCGCCWGWVIRIGLDTIKVDSLPNADIIGYDISTPIPVYIELANIKQDCSTMAGSTPFITKNYYSIKKLILVK